MSASALIAAVHRRRPLWDPTDVHHHNRVVVAGLWKQIGHELGINMMLAKSKWRGLRDYFRQQLKRALEQPESMVGSSWAHYDEMSFLAPSMNPAVLKMQAKQEEEDGEVEQDQTEGKWSPPWSSNQESDDMYPLQAAGTGGTLSPESEDSDDLHFFKSLLPDLRHLPRAKKTYIRLQIQRIVFEEVYGGRKSPSGDTASNHQGSDSDGPMDMPCTVEIGAEMD